jgi:hypothetical protein
VTGRRGARVRWTVAGIAAVAALGVAGCSSSKSSGGTTPGSSGSPGASSSPTQGSSMTPGATGAAGLGPEGIPLQTGPLLADLSSAAKGGVVDGIQCDSSEQVAYHVHSHLAIYVDGQQRSVPIGIGLVQPVEQQTQVGPFAGATQCYYWLHVHAQDGIIHIESPSQRTYTLGNFFDIWGQPLSSTQVGPAKGQVTAYLNGKKYAGDPRTIPLGAHQVIQLNVGQDSPAPQPITWPASGL